MVNATGDSTSRLDRFLTIEGLIEKWSINGQFMDNKVISDHCPMMIGASHLDWGPKTFKFFSMWIDHPNFLPLVEETGSSTNINGKKLFVFKEKLKLLKSKLKLWNLEVVGKVNLGVEEATNDLNLLDQFMANDVISPSMGLRDRRIEAQNQVS